MSNTNIQKLKAGDLRQHGDLFLRKYNDNNGTHEKDRYYPVRLVGRVILPADLIVDSFFRPL